MSINKNISKKNRREIIDKLKQDLISLDINFDKKDEFLKLRNDVNDIINDIQYEINNKKNKNLKKQQQIQLKKQPKSYSKSQQQSEQQQKQSQTQQQKQSQTQQQKPETKKQETNERGFFSEMLGEFAPAFLGLVLALPIMLIFKKDPKTGANIKG
jgi:hypothetical protein